MINICMVVRDRPVETERAIRSLLADGSLGLALTVVDDASLGETQMLLSMLKDKFGFHMARNEEPLGVGGSKNRCVVLSISHYGRGEWLMICDNDIEFHDHTIAKLSETYIKNEHTNNVRILGGYSHPYNGTNEVFNKGTDCEFHEKNAVDGLLWFLRWSTWDFYGTLMDNARGVRQSEDFEYCQRIIKDGFRVGVTWPHVVENRGLIDTFGDEIPGVEVIKALNARNAWKPSLHVRDQEEKS